MANSNLNIALQLTKESVITDSSKKANIDLFHEVLFTDGFKSRQQIVAEVNLLKLQCTTPDLDLENEDHKKLFMDNMKKSKNMVDTCISNSKNNSSYSFNPKYKGKFELKQDENKDYRITEVVEVEAVTKVETPIEEVVEKVTKTRNKRGSKK